MFFNCLNMFWFVKIISKMIRKFTGTEEWKAKNHVKETWQKECCYPLHQRLCKPYIFCNELFDIVKTTAKSVFHKPFDYFLNTP